MRSHASTEQSQAYAEQKLAKVWRSVPKYLNFVQFDLSFLYKNINICYIIS
jgi:hypothetical protein